MNKIRITAHVAWCEACGAVLGQEEIDFECCGCCGGEGFGDEDDEIDWDDHQPEARRDG